MTFQTFNPKPQTDIFTNDTCIDRRACSRVVPMKVLVLGLGRTGTASIRTALKQLGYEDTYHMMSVSVENPPDAIMWQAAFAAKYDGVGVFGKEDWDRLLGHAMAVCDWPAIAFSKELIEAYPDAKVILSNRDPDTWYESVLKTVHWRVTDPEFAEVARLDWGAGYYRPLLLKLFSTFFRGDFPKYGKEVFAEHYAEVRELVPLERLLEYRVTEGWEPMCAFLGHDVPQATFPMGNDMQGFVERCRGRNRAQMGNVAAGALVKGTGTGQREGIRGLRETEGEAEGEGSWCSSGGGAGKMYGGGPGPLGRQVVEVENPATVGVVQ